MNSQIATKCPAKSFLCVPYSGEPFDVFLHAKPVYGLSVDRNNDQIFATAGEDGRVLVFDMRQGTEVLALAKYRAPFHAVQFHPLDGNFVITANGKEGAAFWDLRHTKMYACSTYYNCPAI